MPNWSNNINNSIATCNATENLDGSLLFVTLVNTDRYPLNLAQSAASNVENGKGGLSR